MDKPDKLRVVLRSQDSFEALRLSLAYLRSFSIIFEGGGAGVTRAAVEEELKMT